MTLHDPIGSDPMDHPRNPWPADPVARAAAAAAAGLSRQAQKVETSAALGELVVSDPDARVRAAALGALARQPEPPTTAWVRAASDPEASVRRRAADLSPAFSGREVSPALLELLADEDAAAAEAAAWALGERGSEAVGAGAVEKLSAVAGGHVEPLVREAAVAALGSLGDPGGLPAVLGACRDKPEIRRRAVLALAAFEGPEVEAALRRGLEDRDWQTRQASQDLLGGTAG